MTCGAWAAEQFVKFQPASEAVMLTQKGTSVINTQKSELPGVLRAIETLKSDIAAATGCQLDINVQSGVKALKGKREMFQIIVSQNGHIDILGSDKRGTIYGIYELAQQLGVSPWSWWADIPTIKHDTLYLVPGTYTDGEPVVEYRGIFLNDEAPCLSGWVKEKFPDSKCENLPVDKNGNTYAKGFNHLFYEKVFELLQRLKGNYLWPAMWGNAFYFDDPMNGPLADEMGIIMGTSHHEPMARNHQEWARHRNENGPWDYEQNQKVIDQFFREGIRRAKGTEDLITIGMRGDGDAAMGGKEGHDDEFVSRDQYYINLYEKIFRNQRNIIKQEMGKPANKVPQMWALYKEVQHYFDLGLRVPDDVLIMLCDDNWGDIRRVPEANGKTPAEAKKLRNHPGGWGMYYHVDYVGGPRNTKWANVTTTNHLWEQMRLSYEYGIDRLWILNVGDLKPMEYPIDLFLKMAWRPDDYKEVETVHQHTLDFCERIGGAEGTRLMETYLRYNSRVTPELLNHKTYNLATGEWERAMLQYKALEADALRLWQKMPAASRDAYHQLILFPIQSMANLYEMYYAQAQNQYLAGLNDPEANHYADLVEQCFARDEELTKEYHSIGGGKWNHLMDQTHIGYVIWQQPDKQVCPKVTRVEANNGTLAASIADNIFVPQNGAVVMEAIHYYNINNSEDGKWVELPTLSRTKSALALLPHDAKCEEAAITYAFRTNDVKNVKVHVVTNSTLPFLRKEGHRYSLQIDNGEPIVVNYNSRYVEENTNEMYAIAATRVIETITDMVVNGTADVHTITIRPLDPGLVVEKVVIDLGGYTPQHLFGIESPRKK